MINNYMHFCECITKLTDEEKNWVPIILTFDAEVFDDNEAAQKVLADLLGKKAEELVDVDVENWPGFQWCFEDGDLVLQDNGESFCFDELILFVQAFIHKFRPDEVFTMTWAGTCDKPRTGEFGGGWVVVTKDRTEHEDTWSTVASEVNLDGFYEPERMPRWKLEKFAHFMLQWFFWDHHVGKWDLLMEPSEANTVEIVHDMMQKCGLWPDDSKQLLKVLGEHPRGDER